MNKKKYISKCCKAEVIVQGMSDFINDIPCTMHYACIKCGQGCDVICEPLFLVRKIKKGDK